MNADNAAGRLKAVHWDRLKRRGSLAETSLRMGEGDDYLSGQRANSRGFRVQDAYVSLDIVGNAMPEEVFHEAYFSEPKDPAAILLYSKEFQGLKPDPLLVELTPRLTALAAAGPTTHSSWCSERNTIREIDRLRRQDRQAAYKELERFLPAILARLTGSVRPSMAFCELSSALGVLTALYRLAGRRDDSVDLHALSWSLVSQVKDFAARAEWYQKAAYLLVDLSRYLRADEFIQKAHLFYSVAGAPTAQLGTLVDFAYSLTEQNRHSESLDHLSGILDRLPAAEIHDQISAHQLLATNHKALGNIAAAHKQLDQAFDLIGEDQLAKAYCLWRRAELFLANGDLAPGLSCYCQALPLFANLTGASELAQLALAYASWLIGTGRRSELRQLATDLSGWLEHLKGHIRLRSAIEDFQGLIEMDELNEKSFSDLRERIAAATPFDPLSIKVSRRTSR